MRKLDFILFGLLFLVLVVPGLPQSTYVLEGKVVDGPDGEGLPGATILVRGTTRGVITDFEGNFRMEVTSDETLEISFVGYRTKVVPVNGRTNIDTYLEMDVQSLDEIVVTGYGEIRKSDLTGAVSSVDVEELTNLPVPDVTQALQGRVAGVQITQNSGAPGENTTIRIRGTGSINSNSDPLYVVDGIIVNSINYLSQNDIQSIEVMKDASVASLYGARGANGVIVITTKQGQAGKPKVAFASQFGIQEFWNKLDMMDGRAFRVFSEGLVGGGNAEQIAALHRDFDDLLERGEIEDNDWVDLISQTGVRQQYSASVSGGSKEFSYRFSSNYYNEEGIIIKSDFERINILSDLTFKPVKNVQLRANVLYSNRKRSVQDTNQDKQGLLRRALIDEPTKKQLNEGFPADTPLRKAQDNVDERDNTNLQLKLFFDYQLLQGLKFTSRFGFDRETRFRHRFNPPGGAYIQRFTVRGSDSKVIENGNTDFKWNWDQILSYNGQFGDHNLSLTGAFSLESKNNRSFKSEGVSSLGRDEATAYLDNTTKNFDAEGNESRWTQMGGIFRSNYSFRGKYIAQVNVRADGSSRFAEGNRWGYFPSVSLAWYFSDDLFPNSNLLPSAKLRISYGLLANNRIGNYETFTIVNNEGFGENNNINYVYGSDNNFDIYPGFSPKDLGNPSITWEKTTSYNVGADFDLLGKLFLTVDVFRRHTTDMLLEVPVPLSTGLINNPRRNLGEVINDGIEGSLSYKVEAGNFRFDLGANATYLINRVEDLGPTNDPVFGAEVNNAIPVDFGFVTKTVVGRPIGTFFGYVTDGIDEEGDFIFKDLNNDGKIGSEDRTYLGSPIPDVTYGLVLNVGYKNFDLSAQVQGVYGNSVFNVLRYHTHGYNGTNALSEIAGQAWRNPLSFEGTNAPQEIIDQLGGANDHPNYPRVTGADDDESYRLPSDFYVEDASYLRLRNVQLGYNFPVKALSRLKLESLRLYLTGQNLFTLTEYEGFDPEVGGNSSIAFGVDYGSYPQARLYMVGLDVTF